MLSRAEFTPFILTLDSFKDPNTFYPKGSSQDFKTASPCLTASDWGSGVSPAKGSRDKSLVGFGAKLHKNIPILFKKIIEGEEK